MIGYYFNSHIPVSEKPYAKITNFISRLCLICNGSIITDFKCNLTIFGEIFLKGVLKGVYIDKFGWDIKRLASIRNFN